MNTYCVIHTDKGFKIVEYESFKQLKSKRTIFRTGTYRECLGFIARSNAVQELVASTNKEHVPNYKYEHLYGTALSEQETYTREEVFLIAERVALRLGAIHDGNEDHIKQVINSEIDTLKLF